MTHGAGPASEPRSADLEHSIGRLLTIGTYLSIGLLTIGLVLMVAAGVGPFSGGPAFDPARILADLAALRPEGFLWLGLVAVVMTPTARVAASLVGYVRRGEPRMATISALILSIIILSVVLAKGLEG
jgi:uncharacterized membrane protein